MSERELWVNVYDGSKIGHANVSFYQDGEHQYTIGANIRLEVPQLALPQILPFEPDDGIYRDESAYHLAAIAENTVVSASVPITSAQYDDLLATARGLENETFNYSVFTEACVELVQDFYEATGHPGVFGDLFAGDQQGQSLVWAEVPVSDPSPLSPWPDDTPYYVPPEPILPDPPAAPTPTVFAPMPDPPVPDQVDAFLVPNDPANDEELPIQPTRDLSFGLAFADDVPETGHNETEILAFGQLDDISLESTEDVDEWIETAYAPPNSQFDITGTQPTEREETLSLDSPSVAIRAEDSLHFGIDDGESDQAFEFDFGEPADAFDFVETPAAPTSNDAASFDGLDLMEALSPPASNIPEPLVDTSRFQTEATDYGSMYDDEFLSL